eukprot:TRINITY_DN9123_c1_g4_i1.p1 TRINITY_DN9123_c1_g4~~TRINITY_DN9123_c1_g4_i1.p1  ORF type:complete len:736 (+),score=164.85 TRINITY_DN9123_c1_g4_i1:209-2416(+)
MGGSLCSRRAPPPASRASTRQARVATAAETEICRPGADVNFSVPPTPEPPQIKNCDQCGRPATTRCSRCKFVFYCDKKCQAAAWKRHRQVCKEGLAPPDAAPVLKLPRSIPLCGDGFRKWLESQVGLFGDGHTEDLLAEAPRVGFTNWTNNCYLNAVYQCFLHTPLLRQSLLAACPRPEDRWLAELAGLFRMVGEASAEATGRRTRTIDPPRSLSRLVAEASEEFTVGRQADAHEVIMLLIQRWLTGCVNSGDGSGRDCSKLGYQEKERLEAGSLVGHVFGMSLGQTIACKSCSYTSSSSRVEYCLCLTVTLGMTQTELHKCREESQAQMQQWYLRRPRGMGGSNGAESYVRPTSLDGLLQEYMRREYIPDFKCEKCSNFGAYRGATLRRGPNVLMVYIDRRQDSHLFGKINRRVSFDDTLDLGPWLQDADESVEKGVPVYYRLYGMCVHCDLRGSTASGHYVAYVKDCHGGWHHIDDATVQPVRWEEVQRQHPYILFYAAELMVPPLTVASTASESTSESEPAKSPASPAPSSAPTRAPAAEPAASKAAASPKSDVESSGAPADSTAASDEAPAPATVAADEPAASSGAEAEDDSASAEDLSAAPASASARPLANGVGDDRRPATAAAAKATTSAEASSDAEADAEGEAEVEGRAKAPVEAGAAEADAAAEAGSAKSRASAEAEADRETSSEAEAEVAAAAKDDAGSQKARMDDTDGADEVDTCEPTSEVEVTP